MRIQIALYDGFDLIDAVGPYEILGAGAFILGPDKIQVELATAEGPRMVPTAPTGVRLEADATLDPAGADIIVFPGSAGRIRGEGAEIPMHMNAAMKTGLPALIVEAMERPDTLVATVCGGAVLVGMTGVLKGRHAATHHDQIPELEETGAIAVQARVVDDGDVVSGGGLTSGIDVGLYLLERAFGADLALAVETLFEHERRGTTWRSAAAIAQDSREPVLA